ncbi:meiosis-specific transcription factor ndt80 [Aspergillus nanangensis]|uniref:Meiosis-specific transcription factor ndt80 n=1 Tax=Aspergillus nanangensis TaxID=2582783 RepID=A0AAD4GRL4_ASPNN|nr:meiosis-specific transcription factor ndt80 [Aspergillus nanangensis]
MDGPITTDSDYTGAQRQFPGPMGFPMDEEDSSRRGSSVGHPLAQPVSIPATNGLRYNAQQPAMQDVPFATSPTILMSPSDSCSDLIGYHPYRQNLMFGQQNVLLDPVQRLPQPIADAPPFYETHILQPILVNNQTIKPEIQAKIHKGFFLVDDKWTCYRRNYFSVSCSFSLHPWTHAPLFLKFSEQATERILTFSMSISAIVNEQHGEVRELVQHTPKRDKQSERKPGKVILQPSPPPPLVLGHGAAPVPGQHGFTLTSPAGMTIDYNATYNSAPQPSQPPTQHTFERIQFQKATANNGKRRAQQQYYNLVVELYAEIANPVGGSDTQWVKIARRPSHPMVVRGRSPGHYKDGRRDSSTSMGPDGGNGGSGDGGGGAVLPPSIGQAARSHLTLLSYDSSQRGGPHYGRPDYHHMAASDQSSLSESPHISSSSSSNFDIGVLNESMDPMDTIKSSSSLDSYHDPGYGMMEDRKPGHQYRGSMMHFEYDHVAKDPDEPASSFPEQFDSMVSMIPGEQRDSSHYLKQTPKMVPSPVYHHSNSSSYDPVYSTRTSDDCRLVPSQSLCA